jgi:multidrug efflux pump subunit AcrA (membrane-fusion protein)
MKISDGFRRKGQLLAVTLVIAGLTLVAIAKRRQWIPIVGRYLPTNSKDYPPEDGGDADHEQKGHEHNGAREVDSLQLSQTAWKNIGLKTKVVQPQSYVKTDSVPALVIERPGRSQVEITTPLTGIVTRIYPIEGEALEPQQPVFDLRLTHEDLVTAQRDYLRSAEELQVVQREIERLESVGDGVISGRRILEQQYEMQKIQAALHAQRQALLLHGLNEEQVGQILETRQLLTVLTVAAPPFDEDADHHDVQHLYHVQRIYVRRGQHVTAGDPLCVLADHCLLYIEGQAFEKDAQRLVQAAREGWPMEIRRLTSDSADDDQTLYLDVMYVADQVDPQSRALRFYLALPNQLTRDEREGDHRFVAWKYRPGERMQVMIPIAGRWENQIVLPPEAVVIEGPEAYVFEQNGDHFDRFPVHVLFRDRDAVVIENDGSLVGSTLAVSGAYQMHLALKNRAGSGVDPHAGHSH